MNRERNISELLKKTPKADLEALLLELAQSHDSIGKIIQLRFSPDGSDAGKIKQEIRVIIDDCSDRYGFIDYRSSFSFEKQMFHLIDNTFPRLISEKNTRVAFDIICAFFFEFGKLEIDDSNGYLGSLMHSIMEYFEKTISQMKAAEKNKAFIWIEDHLEDEKIVDYIRDDIFTAYINFFTDKNHLEHKISYFDKFLNEYYSSSNLNDFHYSFKLKSYAENRLTCMEKLNTPENEILNFCKKYEKLPELSNRIADLYISKKQYTEVEKIYLQIIADNSNWPGVVSDYKTKLLELYKMSSDIEKQKPILKDFIFSRMDINLNYYREYKSFFAPEEWKTELDSLLNSARFNSQVETILFEEQMIEELFLYIVKMHGNPNTQSSTTLSSLNEYGKYFEPAHSAELVQMYSECLDAQMNYASSRPMYADVANSLKKMMNFTGGTEKARELKESWLERYRNRPAMKDELNKILN